MTRKQAERLGRRDGIEDVDTVLAEQGRDSVIATLAPGSVSWDEGAINAGVARIVGVPERLERVYYRAYDEGARARAQEIAAALMSAALGE